MSDAQHDDQSRPGQSGGGLPPAGWYPDPAGGPARRWWDGAGWTHDLEQQPGAGAPGQAAPTPAPASTPEPASTPQPSSAHAPVEPQPTSTPDQGQQYGGSSYGASSHGSSATYGQQYGQQSGAPQGQQYGQQSSQAAPGSAPQGGLPSYGQFQGAGPAGAAPVQQGQDWGRPQQQPLAPGTSLLTPWVWIIALLPLISLVDLLTTDFSSLVDSATATTTTPVPVMSGREALSSLLGIVLWGLTVLFAWLDHKALRERGVVKPFHWAFAAIPVTLVYLIGRFVVLRRRTGNGAGLPLWVHIAVVVLTTVVSMVVVGSVMAEVFAEVSSEFSTAP